MIDVDVEDMAGRALHAFWQGALPVLIGAQFTSWPEAKAVAIAAGVAGGSAVLSMLKGTAKAWLESRRSPRYSPRHSVRASAQDRRPH